MPHGTSHILSMRRARCSAFTMVELLAATALASLLMLAVLQVTASLGHTRTMMQAQPGSKVWQLDVAAQLQRDLAQARHATLEDDGTLRLEGPLGLDLLGRGGDHLPAIVRYRLVEAGAQKLLVREQRNVLDRTGRDRQCELVAMHVERFAVELIRASREEDDGDESSDTAVDEHAEADAPLLAVRVVISFADDRHSPVTVHVAKGSVQEVREA